MAKQKANEITKGIYVLWNWPKGVYSEQWPPPQLSGLRRTRMGLNSAGLENLVESGAKVVVLELAPEGILKITDVGSGKIVEV